MKSTSHRLRPTSQKILTAVQAVRPDASKAELIDEALRTYYVEGRGADQLRMLKLIFTGEDTPA